MLIALALAAFGGGALGLVWQSAGFGDEEDGDATEERLVTDEESSE